MLRGCLKMNLLSALLLILSYPSFNLWWLAWLGLVPLMISLARANTDKQSFLRGYLFGFLFWLGTIWWVGYVTLFGALMLILYLSLYSGIFGWAFWRLWKKEIRNFRFILLISGAWTILEWIRSYLFTGFGWNLLGYSQAPNLLLIQIADIVGALGVSFLVVWVNGVIFLIWNPVSLSLPAPKDVRSPKRRLRDSPQKSACLSLLSEKIRQGCLALFWGSDSPRRRPRFGLLTRGQCRFEKHWIPSVMTLILLVFVLGYGYYRLNQKIPTQPVSIAVIQGNVPQNIKWEEQYRSMLFERYEILTKTAAIENPQLIIWPETSIVEDFSNPEIQNRIAGIAREANSFLLVGAPWEARRDGRSVAPTPYFNSAILFNSQGNLIQRYDKLHLVPYGEFIPFEKQFPFQRNWIVTGDFTRGKEHTVFTIPRSQFPSTPSTLLRTSPLRTGPAPNQVGFSVLICFEDIFPGLASQFVKKGARLLINISNDAWFHESGAAFQHAQASVFRAVENRVPVVRATNTGFSCFIDRWGRVQKNVLAFITSYATAVVQIPN
jgi:apolipoprotein N-acyltransferase